jgi:hypothetical protein
MMLVTTIRINARVAVREVIFLRFIRFKAPLDDFKS